MKYREVKKRPLFQILAFCGLSWSVWTFGCRFKLFSNLQFFMLYFLFYLIARIFYLCLHAFVFTCAQFSIVIPDRDSERARTHRIRLFDSCVHRLPAWLIHAHPDPALQLMILFRLTRFPHNKTFQRPGPFFGPWASLERFHFIYFSGILPVHFG